MLSFYLRPVYKIWFAYLCWAFAIVSCSAWWNGLPRYFCAGGATDIIGCGGIQPARWSIQGFLPALIQDKTLIYATVLVAVFIGLGCLLWLSGQRDICAAMPTQARSAAQEIIGAVARSDAFSTQARSANAVQMITGTLQRALGLTVKSVAQMIALQAAPLAVGIVIAIGYAGVIGFVCVVVSIVPVIAVGAFSGMIRKSSASNQASSRALTAQFLDAIRGLETTAYFGATEREGDRIAKLAKDSRDKTLRLLAVNQVILFILDFTVYGVHIAVVTGLTLYYVVSGAIYAGAALTIIALMTLVLMPIDNAGIFFVAGFGGRTAREQIKKFVAPKDRENEVFSASSSVIEKAIVKHQLGDGGIALEMQGVEVSYSGDSTPIKLVDCVVNYGEHVVIAGKSGCGKSTLAYVLAGILKPKTGTVKIFGSEPNSEPSGCDVAVVSQRPWMWHATIMENLRLACPDVVDAKAENLMQRVGLVDELGHDWRDIQVFEEGRGLSGGQLQRLALVQALLLERPILIADEPTSAVDPVSQQIILSVLNDYEGTVLHIAHRDRVIGDGHRVIRFDDSDASGSQIPDGAKTKEEAKK